MKKTQPRRACQAKQVMPNNKSRPCHAKQARAVTRNLARAPRAMRHDRTAYPGGHSAPVPSDMTVPFPYAAAVRWGRKGEFRVILRESLFTRFSFSGCLFSLSRTFLSTLVYYQWEWRNFQHWIEFLIAYISKTSIKASSCSSTQSLSLKSSIFDSPF